MPGVLFEVSVDGIDNLMVAQESGADRVELCADTTEGGITPSVGAVRRASQVARIPFSVMVRPRGGDFVYSKNEFEVMCEDVIAFRQLGIYGVVGGCLQPNGQVDTERTAELVQLAGEMSFTFHRAFDFTPDPEAALEALVNIGVTRILTSGGSPTALEGSIVLKRLGEIADGRVIVMPCGSIRADNVSEVRRVTGLREFHFAAHSRVGITAEGDCTRSAAASVAAGLGVNKIVTDPSVVRATVQAGRKSHGIQ